MNFYGYSIRMTKEEDPPMVQAMLHHKLPALERLFGKIDILKICEMSLYSMVAFSAENKMVAFAAFDDNPMATIPPGFPRELVDKAGRWAVQAALDLGYRREMLLWTTLCANVFAGGEEELTLHRAMLSSVLVLSHDTMVILETSSLEFGNLQGLLKPLAYYQKEDFKLSVVSCRRSFLFPRLFMRRAREEDQDDLTPVIEHAQQRGLPLTEIPESACPSQPYAIARLIAAQNKENSVFVAQVNNRIMGVIALTSDVHLPSLHENYDLECFEGLMPKTIVRKLTVIAAKEVDQFFVDPLAAAVSESETEAGVTEQEKKEEEEVPVAPTTETFIRWPEDAFRIAMLCMEVEYESRAIDVINFAFSNLIAAWGWFDRLSWIQKLNKEFCLVTLPYVSPFHPLLHFFYRVPARLNAYNEDKELSADSRCLYLLHVDALSPGFAVRPLQKDDKSSLAELLDNFADEDRLLDTAFHPPEEKLRLSQEYEAREYSVLSAYWTVFAGLNMVAVLSNQVVGFAMLDNTAPVAEIASHFDLGSLLHLQHHLFQKHASMVLYVLNPVYRYRSRLFLQEIMRQTGKSVIYCPIFPQMELPDVLEDLILVPGRQHAHMAPPCYWTVPPPEEDEGENGSTERSSSKTSSAGSTPRTTADLDKTLNHLKRDLKTLDISAQDIHQDLVKSAASDENNISNNNHKPVAESGGQESQDLPAKSNSTMDTESEGNKIRDMSDEAGREENAEHNVSAQGGQVKHGSVEEGVKESTLGKTGETEGTSGAGSKDVAAIGEVNNEAIEDDQKEFLPSEADDRISVDSPTIETEVCPIRRGYFHGFDCALYVLTHKSLYRYKTVINARIVVVGSSITTASFLHRLLASHELQFTNLIMISNVGFKRLSSTSSCSLMASLGPKHSFPKLGLDCQVKVIKAHMKGIDRKERTVRLSTGQDLPYDWLVLSPGLQDQTKRSIWDLSAVRGGVVKADELVLNTTKFAKGLTASAGKRMPIDPVFIYGATLSAFSAIQALLQEGVDGKDLLLVHPETVNIETAATQYLGDTETSQMILASLIQAGLSIHSGLKLVGVEKNASTGWISALQFQELVEEEDLDGMSVVPTSLEKLAKKSLKPLEALEEVLEHGKCPIHKVIMGDREKLKTIIHAVDKSGRPERKLKVPCSMLVTGNKQQVDLELFRAIHKEALIFDGRIVVDGCFQTNDPLIFAAGSSCKFSRHCGDNLPKGEAFCPWEVGEALAPAVKAVIVTAIYGSRTRCASEEYVEILMPHKWPRPNLPSLKKARCTAGCLPGEQQFFSATAPKFCTPLAGPPALSLHTRTAEAYCRLDIMDNKEIGRVIYFGKARLEEWKIVRFVGLPDTLIQDLILRWENDEVPDIAEYLLKPWATFIFHDKFPSFFQLVSDDIKAVMRNSRTSMTVFLAEIVGGKIKSLEPKLTKQSLDLVYMKLMKFLKEHENDLPTYKKPRKVE